ncbi:hypothetical protein C8F04DRAFT_1403288 [Mycena alexandri]|uniref:Uncharacterized protein n=1 Tax=Mycena alexandri TaxID=1745969 RepID=A0AAD6S688_9AGAR|nr:hypothetical protein C8F04DRAFT_1403288 [Mycena alexandri]
MSSNNIQGTPLDFDIRTPEDLFLFSVRVNLPTEAPAVTPRPLHKHINPIPTDHGIHHLPHRHRTSMSQDAFDAHISERGNWTRALVPFVRHISPPPVLGTLSRVRANTNTTRRMAPPRKRTPAQSSTSTERRSPHRAIRIDPHVVPTHILPTTSRTRQQIGLDHRGPRSPPPTQPPLPHCAPTTTFLLPAPRPPKEEMK